MISARHLKAACALSLPALALLCLTNTSAFAACSTPAGNEGDVIYSSTQHVMAYCNSANWISMGAPYATGFGTLTGGDLCMATSGTNISCSYSLSGDVTSSAGTAAATTVAAIRGVTVSGTTGTGNVVFSAAPTLTGTVTLSGLTTAGVVSVNGSGVLSSAATLTASEFPALTGDVTNAAGSLATTVGSIGGKTVTLGGGLTTAGAFTISGAFALTLTTTATTNITLPTSGTVIATATSSPAQGDVLYYNGSAWTDLAHGTSGQYLQTQGASANPQWATLTIGTGALTGTVQVAQGGTGDATLTTYGLLAGAGTGNVASIGPGTSGQLLIAQGASSNPAFETVSGDIAVTNAGAATVGSLGGKAVSLGGALTTAGAFTTSGAYSLTLTTTGATNVTLPTTGTLVAGSGTANYVPLFTGASTLGNSVIYQSGSSVGIGTTSPSVLLNTYGGNTRLQYGASSTGNEFLTLYPTDFSSTIPYLFMKPSAGAWNIGMWNGSAVYGTLNFQAPTATFSGNVGIGTTGPIALLDVYGNSTAGDLTLGPWSGSSSYNAVYLNGATATVGSYNIVSGKGLDLFINRPTGYNIHFREGNGSDQMNIQATTGNVGIGTTSPNNILTVSGNYNGSTDGFPADSGEGQFVVKGVTNPNLAFAIGVDTTNQVVRLQGQIIGSAILPLSLNPQGGNVGIGTTGPNATLQVVNSTALVAAFTGSPSSSSNYIRVDSQYGSGYFGTYSNYPAILFSPSQIAVWFFNANNGYHEFYNAVSGHTMEIQNTGQAYSWGWNNFSDMRLKKNVRPLSDVSGLAAIGKLRPVMFNWKDQQRETALQYGFIAQDVQKVLPDLVTTGLKSEDTPDGMLSLNYNGLIAPLVKAVQELKSDNDNEAAQIKTLTERIEALEAARH